MSEQDRIEQAIHDLCEVKNKFIGSIHMYQVYDLAITALQTLEKQIPKKPIDKARVKICPHCKCGTVEYGYGYCRVCGGALDWRAQE